MTLEKMKKILDNSNKRNDEFICIAIEFPFKKIPKGDVGSVIDVNLKKRSFTINCKAGRFEAKESEIDMVEYLYNFNAN
mgnify:CR=1 FL=1|tara:strand:+ start:60 stop:296 length:237 start_codon:yes stop_codon:yes gene_type:complete